MDYSKLIKSLLESNELNSILDELQLDRDSLLTQVVRNICCSNNSYVFIYLEQSACFLALSLDRMCKSEDKSYSKSFQRLNINAVPIGAFKKIEINSNGTLILLIYDKSLSVVQLPSNRYGKYGLYEGGKANCICKSFKFNLNNRISVVDALWHPKTDEDCVVCLTNDSYIRFFLASNPKQQYKEFYFSDFSMESISASDIAGGGNRSSQHALRDSKLFNFEIGCKFEYEEKHAYPIYILKSSGEIYCLIEFDNSRKFKFIGSLTLVPYCMDYEENQVVSFMCLPKHPNGIVLLLNNGVIYHCVFMPNSSTVGYESINLNDEANGSLNGDPFLFVYESIKLDESSDFKSIRFIKDQSNSSRYFACHSTGIHSVYLPWLENMQLILEKPKALNLNQFDETEYCEISHLICTRPFVEKNSSSSIIGATVLFDFAKTDRMLIALTNQFRFICINVEIADQNLKMKQATIAESELVEKNGQEADQFANYIVGILKKNSNLPIIRSDYLETDEAELNHLVKNTLNLIKVEYIERQKRVIAEFQKRCKILKQQENLQYETVKEVNDKIESFKERKTSLSKIHEKLISNQEELEKQIENVLNKLQCKRSVPITVQEIDINHELNAIKFNSKDFEEELKESKILISRLDSARTEKSSQVNVDDNWTNQMKNVLKNQSEKIWELIQKTEMLKQAVKK